MLKYQVGKKEDALKILQKLIDGQLVLLGGKPVYLNTTYRAAYTAIYKNVVEILIQSNCMYVFKVVCFNLLFAIHILHLSFY